MPTVLVLDGQSGPALSVTRSLGRAGWRVLARDGTRSARSRYGQGRPLVDATEPGFRDSLAALVRREPVDLIVPCTDASVAEVWRSAAVVGGAYILGGDRRSAARSLDKVRTLAAADEHGFPTPRWLHPATRREALAAIEEFGFPLVIKPITSYVREGSGLRHRRHRVITSIDEAEAALTALSGPGLALPLIQEFVPGRALAVTAVLHNGIVLALVARETLSFSPVTGGTSVWKRTIAPSEPGVRQAVEFLQELEYEGLAEVEYQVPADGTPRLMEIGARAHGWLGLAIAAGVDLPLIAASALLGAEAAPTPDYKVGLEMRWLAGEVSRLRVAMSRRPQLPPDVSRLDLVRSAWPPWRPGMRYDGMQLSDPRPWLSRRKRPRTTPDELTPVASPTKV
jgi:predicted ATP-grasp superfamily ATP-dependent carboligase